MIQVYQYLPSNIDPIVLTVGSFSLRWYALMYLVGFAVVYQLLLRRIKKNEMAWSADILPKALIVDFLFFAFIGLLIGGRLAYVLFYDFSYFLAHPLAIISPFDFSAGVFTGIYGMSYFGGLIGVILATVILVRKRNISFWVLADFVVPAIPAGYFFGRIGNFLNGELYGRATEKIWGMYFPADPSRLLRHPSQLYEAFFEGIVLFLILWLLRNNKKIAAYHLMLPVYLFGYGFVRLWIEFFREPDSQIGLISWLSLGQILTLALMVIAIGIGLWRKRKTVI